MALASNTRLAPFGAIATYTVVTRVEAVFSALVEWNTKRKTTKILSQLSDRELADIGLIRGDLDNIPTRF
ncbi:MULTISPECIES: DUF1127 domain-containing protein [Rhodobacterales]|uniref:DUF1127 domain-containing protein n=1 Tax=Roseobacter sp. N2S TaxID=2663844 RepID=UPI00285AF8E0|nr:MULTISPECIES: DUF1127 domain-containing protein [Rhodobacterales]MDR6263943.1 uncharacterized protein YjiS (DUF1127 family) [Roseobacter sp. N2S]